MLGYSKLHEIVHREFAQVNETCKRLRPISLADTLMSGFAVFSLKYPSLLQFDQHSQEEQIRHNLKTVFQIDRVPSDTQMRERLDDIDPLMLRKAYKRLFAQCQRSKKLEAFAFYQGKYLMPFDGTGYFYSNDVHCENCCQKTHKDGQTSYYHQMLTNVIVHPDLNVVLPFAPEPIMKEDGSTKNDCERNAAKRLLSHLQREHPHLDLIITGDGLYSNGPFIKRLKSQGYSFILVAKEKDHKALFEELRALPCKTHEIKQEKKTHRFEWVNGIPLNDSHPDCLVNVLEYWEEQDDGKKQHWVWVTDIELNTSNVYQIMRGGRARHKIENETFNTLKNQGYHYNHNFGHGNKNLSTVFAYLMVLAFFVDQLMQLGCKAFKKALQRLKSKKTLWERKRGLFFNFFVESLDDMWNALACGHRNRLMPDTS